MTTHVRDALEGRGIALEFDSQTYQYVVTMKSVLEYAKDKVRKALASEPLWAQKYQLPTPQFRGPEANPIRVLEKTDLAPLTVHIDPEDASDQTTVRLILGLHPLEPQYCYPPNKNHQTVYLQPQRHLLVATSSFGQTAPNRQIVDLREQHEQIVSVLSPGGPPLPPDKVPDDGGPPPYVQNLPGPRGFLDAQATTGMITATSLEPQVEISIQSLQAPYTCKSSPGKLLEEVPVGPYQIQFRLGPDIFSQREIYVQAGEIVVVDPSVALTPLIQEALGPPQQPPTSVVMSESIGPMQAALLPTMLPLLGSNPLTLRTNCLDNSKRWSNVATQPPSATVLCRLF